MVLHAIAATCAKNMRALTRSGVVRSRPLAMRTLEGLSSEVVAGSLADRVVPLVGQEMHDKERLVVLDWHAEYASQGSQSRQVLSTDIDRFIHHSKEDEQNNETKQGSQIRPGMVGKDWQGRQWQLTATMKRWLS